MRIDIANGERRQTKFKMILGLLQIYVGSIPGPMLFFSYDKDQIPDSMLNYMLRGSAHSGYFNKSKRELLSTFVSDLNSCHF